MTTDRTLPTSRACWLSVVLLLSLVTVVGMGVAADEVITVAMDGSGDHETIQDAVNESSAGDTILVEAGTYEEEVTVDVDGLTLRAADGDRPILDGAGSLNTSLNVTAEGVTVDGFEVRNYDPSDAPWDTPVVRLAGADVLVNDTVIADNQNADRILWVGGDEIELANLTVRDNGGPDETIQVDGEGVELRDSAVRGNGDSSYDSAISVDGNGFTVRNTELVQNSRGLSVLADDLVVEDSNVSANEDRGITLQSMSGAEIVDSRIADNGEEGIYQTTGPSSRAADDVTILDNTITGNNERGIYLSDGDRAEIRRNVISDNGGGVLVANEATVANNSLVGNSAGSIVIGGISTGTNSTVSNNTITDVSGTGISVGDGSVVESNDVDIPGGDLFGTSARPSGINVDADTVVTDNDVSIDETAAGLTIGGANNTITGNAFDNGVYLAGPDPDAFADEPLTMQNNLVNGEALYYARDVTNPDVDGNAPQVILVNVTDADVSGLSFSDVVSEIQVVHGDGVTVSDNSVTAADPLASGGARASIAIWGSTDVTISNNDLGGDGSAGEAAPLAEDRSGIHVSTSQDVTVANNTIYGESGEEDTSFTSVDETGISVEASTAVVVDTNHVEGFTEGIVVDEGDAVTIKNGTIDDTVRGIELSQSSDTLIENNAISDSKVAGIEGETPDFDVRGNTITNSGGTGINLAVADDGNQSIIASNAITDNGFDPGYYNPGAGIYLEGASWGDIENLTVTDNDIENNEGQGIYLDDPAGNVSVTGNVISGNDVGLRYDEDRWLNATFNWWGDDTGPSGGVQDARADEVATGDGDSVVADAENVSFYPWDGIDPPPPVSAEFVHSPLSPDTGEPVTFNASDSVALFAQIEEYRWDFTGDGVVDEATESVEVNHTYDAGDSYDVTLTVEDADGRTNSTTTTLDVVEPQVEAAFDWAPLNPDPGAIVNFDATNATTPTGTIVEYRWDWGDGGSDTSAGPEIAHTYAAPDSYEVTLEVENDQGETNTTTETIHVVEEGDSIWNYTTDERIGGSSPTIVDGTAYVGDFNGTVYAIDVATGTTEWTFHHDTYREHDSPTVVDGTVYIASRDAVRDGTLYAVDAETGDELWNAPLDRAPRGTTVYGDTVYVTTGPDPNYNNGYVLAYDVTDGSQRWDFETTTPTTSAPTVTDGTVYAGDDVGTLYAVEAETGGEQWTFEGESTIPRAPAVDNGTVYVATNDLIPNPEITVNQYQGYVYALDAADGSEVWAAPYTDDVTNRGITSAPTVSGGTIYVGGGEEQLLAIDASDGSEVWSFQTHAHVRSAPTVVSAPGEIEETIDEALVYVGNDDGTVYAVGATTGAAHWIFDAGRWVRSSPTVADGVVYVGADHFDPGDPDTAIDDGISAGDLYALDAGISGSSSDSRVELATLGHNELIQPYFAVTIDDTNTPVLEGETLTINTTVRNLGGEGTQTVEIEDFNGNVVETTTLTLEYNEEKRVNVTVETQEGDAAIDDVVVRSEADSDSEAVGIQQEVDFAGCRVLDTPGVYTLTGGQSSDSTCIVINSSYVELDGQGHVLVGGGPSEGSMDPGAHGVHVNGSEGQLTNVVIDDLYLDDWASFGVDNAAIRIENVTDSEITNSTVESSYYGIWADDLTNSVIEGNDLTGASWWGISMEASSNNVVTDTEIASPYYGLYLYSGSDDNVITDSVIAANTYGLLVSGSSGNTVSNVDARYNHGDVRAPHDLPDFYASDSSSVPVENYTMSAPSNVTIESIDAYDVGEDTITATDQVELDLSAVPAPDINVSFEARNVDLEATHAPADNPDAHALGQYIAVREESGDSSYLDLEIHYEEAHLDGADETDLSLWLYDRTDGEWSELAEQSVDADRNVVATNLTEFGTVGVFVNDPGSADPGAPATAEVTDVTIVAAGDNAWQNLETSATHAGGTNWTATIDADDLPESEDDTYDLWMTVEDEYGGGRSIDIAKTLAVTDGSTCIDEAVAGDDGVIDLDEIQEAIDWWATDAEVPDTGGETISLSKIQELIDAWATDEQVAC